jgi:hypothetical protein
MVGTYDVVDFALWCRKLLASLCSERPVGRASETGQAVHQPPLYAGHAPYSFLALTKKVSALSPEPTLNSVTTHLQMPIIRRRVMAIPAISITESLL